MGVFWKTFNSLDVMPKKTSRIIIVTAGQLFWNGPPDGHRSFCCRAEEAENIFVAENTVITRLNTERLLSNLVLF